MASGWKFEPEVCIRGSEKEVNLNMVNSISEKVNRIREIVFEPRLKQILMRKSSFWSQLGIAMYTIEDTELAIESSEKEIKIKNDHGVLYLRTYGLLQALFLQQDAVRHLSEATDIPFDLSDYPGLKDIRDLRNDSIGHPTKRGGSKPSYHGIIRQSMSPDSFHILSIFADGNTKRREINFSEVVRNQRELIGSALDAIIKALEQEVDKHKQKFQGKSLESIFTVQMGYYLETMREATRDIDSLPVGQAGFESVRNILNSFKSALKDRELDIDTYPGVYDVWEELQYPLSALGRYFNLETEKGFIPENQTANIFVWYVGQKMDDLREMAREIDIDYNKL
jgi:hypothetical protein